MTHLEIEMQQLKEAVIEMTGLVLWQLENAKEAYLNMDVEIAQEIIHNESRIDAIELSIDRDCENMFALFQPVATDLRFVIAVLKINSDLERIGDYAESIALYVIDQDRKADIELIEATKLNEMFEIAFSMLHDIKEAFEEEDAVLARKVYMKDVELNQINREASRVISDFVKKVPESVREALFLFSIIRKIERVGDHIKNIAEDIIFHSEAIILKHRRKNGGK